ncbi:MAG: replicative DNA helicase [Leptospirales bacterium]
MGLFDSETEQIVLGSILQSPDLFHDISQVLREEDFYFEPHRIIYETIAEEFDKQNTPDVMLVISSLKTKELLEKSGNRSAIMEIASLGSPVSALSYARQVKEYSLRRGFLTAIKEMERDIQDKQTDLDTVLSEAEKAVTVVSNRHTQYNIRHIREVKDEFLLFLQKLKESKGGITGLQTFFSKFDQITTGLKGGQLIVLAARPGAGKTTFALNVAQNAAIRGGEPVLVFSLEMTRLELLLRLVCADAYLDSGKIQRGYINDKEGDKILESIQRINGSELYIDDSAELTSWDFRQRSRRLSNQLIARNKKIGLIIVDYLQLMTDKSRNSDSRQIEVANISRSLKMIAKELDVPIIAVSQMNRSIEQRGKDPRPQLSDLRESGAIEQDADIVMFIHREEMFNKDIPPELAGQAEVIIAKHRAGAQGTFKLAFVKEKNLFMDLETIDEPDNPPSEYI